MDSDIQRILIDPATIAQRVAAVAQEIIRDLKPHGDSLTLVPILTGSVIFLADLMRQLPMYMRLQLISVSSYPGTSTTPGKLDILTDLQKLDLAGRDVLVIDDILDSGQTLAAVTRELRTKQLASLHTCVLLRKKRSTPPAVDVDYACFDIPDEFVVGYGLDYNDFYRNLPAIAILRPEAIERHVQKVS